MASASHQIPAQTVRAFRDSYLPEGVVLAGYSALINAYDLQVPTPLKLAAIGKKHKILTHEQWTLYTPRHEPDESLAGHLIFALKYEGLDLGLLKALFLEIGAQPVEDIVRETPSGSYARRLWFLYEWLLETRLDLPDAAQGRYTPIVDPALQWAIPGQNSPRHRVKNNLPGTSAFCPLVFRTEALNEFVASDLKAKARQSIAELPKDLITRTAAFLLLKDSKSSYAIEGEAPPQTRIQRWAKIIGEAGRQPITVDELIRLQHIVIGDARFVYIGLRTEGGFVGEHDRTTQAPIPDHISAKPEDLEELMEGLVHFDQHIAPDLDPVIAAAVLAFAFVYIHPFQDGNGRIHRYLIHHVLAQRGFNPPDMAFPISSAILDNLSTYRETLESYSTRALPCIEWRPTRKNNVEVLNDTADLYRFFDATPHAHFLYQCVQQTIEQDIPEEAQFLQRHDAFRRQILDIVDMPDRTVELLFNFLHQNNGTLSKRARTKEFAKLTEDEAQRIQAIYADLFNLC